MNLRAARNRHGWSIYDLAERTGVAASNISALETGSRIMGKRLAGKFAQHLNTDSAELLIPNRAAAMERAMKKNDVSGVLWAVKAIVEVAQEHDFTNEGDDALSRRPP